ncbi:MAG: DNA-binding protein WhiA [Ruminococcaceae bacterium]|nr:DNA-binding protein WhiA [Oscillospiraceae bacterium]
MSFAEHVKRELISLPVKMNCCRKALLFGLLYNAQTADNGRMRVSLSLEESAVLARELLGDAANVTVREGFRAGRKIWEIEFSSKSFSAFLSKISHGQSVSDAAKFRCEECRVCFIRGIMISCATLNDPHKGYHLEVPVARVHAERATPLSDIFEECGFLPKRTERKNSSSVYFKSNAVIADILNYSGAMQSGFDMANVCIERDIRNNENRATNCMAKNISKSVDATKIQLAAINKLIETNRLERLPKELIQTARLRLENNELSLSELAKIHEPPISKSGLNHRLEKICRAADEIN